MNCNSACCSASYIFGAGTVEYLEPSMNFKFSTFSCQYSRLLLVITFYQRKKAVRKEHKRIKHPNQETKVVVKMVLVNADPATTIEPFDEVVEPSEVQQLLDNLVNNRTVELETNLRDGLHHKIEEADIAKLYFDEYRKERGLFRIILWEFDEEV